MAQLTDSQQAFIDRYAPYANLASMQTGLPARVILGKLAIESNWGSQMYANNIAGLKPGADEQNAGSLGYGATGTFEDTPGGRKNITDKFLKYGSPEEGIGGFVNWLTNSGISGINSLVDRPGGGIFAPDAKADQSAINAFNASPYSTDKNLATTLPQRVGMIPDLSQYGIATSFDPSVNRLDQIAPARSSGFDVSNGAGAILNNDYASEVEYQPQGYVTPRDKTGVGIELPSPQMAPTGQQYSALDAFSDSLTGGLREAGRAIAGQYQDALGRVPSVDELKQWTDAVGNGTTSVFDVLKGIATGGEAQQHARQTGIDPSSYIPNQANFSGLNVSSGVGNGSLPGVTPYAAAPGAYDFAANYYAANPDVKAAGMDAWQHFANFGSKEKRAIDTAGDHFDASKYASQNADVQQAGFNPLTHYIEFGANEGRGAPIIGPDGTVHTVSNLGLTPTLSASLTGMLQGAPGLSAMSGAPQSASTIGAGGSVSALPPGFSEQAYYAANPDVAAAHIPAAEHYTLFGGREGRAIAPDGYAPTIQPQMASTIGAPDLTPTIGAPSAVRGFDPAEYLRANPDVAASGMNPLQHFETFGLGENRAINTQGDHLSQNFDGAAYLAKNQDVAMAGLNPLDNYLKFGAAEGRDYQTGVSPFSFSSFGVGGGVGAQPQSMASAYGVTPTPTVSNLGFSGLDAGGGLGAQPQSMGSMYGVTPNSSVGTPSASSMGTSGLGVSGGIGFGQGIDAIGAPKMSVVGGLLANVARDGTTIGTKSLAQTNNEFNAVANFANAQSKAQTQNLGMAAIAPMPNIIGLSTAVVPSYYSAPRWL